MKGKEKILYKHTIILTDSDEELKQQAAKAWSIWEASTSKLYVDEKSIARYGEDNFSLAFARNIVLLF
ncbi:MAG: hypothetical protein AB8V06_08400 [Francisella endosymbiont of Hyalomma asiaticum]